MEPSLAEAPRRPAMPKRGPGGRRRAAAAAAAAAGRAAHSARLLDDFLAGLGSRSHGRHGRTLPAGRARPVRLPPRLLLAGAGARSAQPRAGLDEEVRRRAEGLAQDRPDLPVTAINVTDVRRPRLPLRLARSCARARSSLSVACTARRRRRARGRRRPAVAGNGHDLRRHLQGRHRRHRRGDREGDRRDPAQDRHSRSTLHARPTTVRASTCTTPPTRRSRSSIA